MKYWSTAVPDIAGIAGGILVARFNSASVTVDVVEQAAVFVFNADCCWAAAEGTG